MPQHYINGGFLDWMKRKEGFTKHDRKALKRRRGELITSIQITRYPIMTGLTELLNLFTLGSLSSGMKKMGYEKLFHLSLIINNDYVFEKQEVVKFYKRKNFINEFRSKGIEVMTIPLPAGFDITVDEFVENTKQLMGKKFTLYDAITNNCQVFVRSALQANGLYSNEANAFVFQDIKTLLGKHKAVHGLALGITDLGAIANRVAFGRGLQRKTITHY